jgi:leader peptidase (prepilin peptidase)/N-methyltransferase
MFQPELIEPVASIFVFAFGLILGSFMNVCILRLPLGESVVHPRSRCPGCKSPIAWYQNLPVLSWVALRGKCARCGERISPRYPFVEALSGAIALALWMVYGPDPRFLIATPFALALVVLFFTDFDHQLLPDAVTLSGTVLGLAVAWFNPFLGGEEWHRVWMALAGAALGSGLLWSVGAVYGKLRGVEAMGLGDVKMMAFVGAFVGPTGVLFTIFGASLVGAAFGLALIPMRGRTLRDTLPFGCFLAPAAMAALMVGRQAFEAYFSYVFR